MDARSISWIVVSLFVNWCENRECDLGLVNSRRVSSADLLATAKGR
jgi:hypothetical protein